MLWLQDGELTAFRTFAIVVEVLLGYLTFTGSLMAAGKLQEVLPTRPITYKNQNVINLLLLAIAIGSGSTSSRGRRPGSCSPSSSCCRCCSASC
jgi:NAD/NADP transhydrogenase beta subunit